MPYKIHQVGNKFKVVAENTGHVAGTHPTKEKAQAQMAALYANEPEARKCMTCGCDDLGNDHHYIPNEKCLYCTTKGQGPCWDGYQYAGTKEQDGKTVPNCIPVKKESAGAGELGGGTGFALEFNVPDCQGGWAVTKSGTGQVLACYTTKEHAQAAMDALAVNQPDMTKSDEKGQVEQNKQEGIGRLSFWDGSLAPVFGYKQYQDARYNSTYNTPPQHDGKPTVGYGNSSSPKGRSNQ